MRTRVGLIVLVLALFPLSAAAKEEGRVLVGLRAAGSFGQPFGPFGVAIVPELEVGFGLVPVTLFVAGQYSAPVAEGEIAADPRLPDPRVTRYRLTRQTLAVTLGLMYQLDIGSDRFFPYGSVGPRLYLTRTVVEASAGEDFGTNEETASDVGFAAGIGTEMALGPGRALVELQLGWAALDGTVLRATSAGALNLLVGYRLRF